MKHINTNIVISLKNNKSYKEAKRKYGKIFVNAVLLNELRLLADSLGDRFEDYANPELYPLMHHLIKKKNNANKITDR